MAEPSLQPLRNQLSRELRDLISNQRGCLPQLHSVSQVKSLTTEKEGWKGTVEDKNTLVGVVTLDNMNSSLFPTFCEVAPFYSAEKNPGWKVIHTLLQAQQK